jgi:tripartite-type tricarboxylate transporter receptor subunit TctC
MNDALGAQFEILSINAGPAVTPHIRSGKLRPLAVGAPARLESLPKVPTLAELKLPAANLTSVFGVFAPAGTPPILIAKYNVEINKALESPDLRAKLMSTDNVPTGGTAQAFADEIADEYESNARIIKAAGIKAD